MIRTNTCGGLTKKEAGKKVKLVGWVDTIRDHKKIIFIDLRDRYGYTQVVLNPNKLKDAKKLKNESVILINGEVKERPNQNINKNIATGEIEVIANSLEILNLVEELPFDVNDRKEISEDLRLKYRYLYLRRPNILKNFITRHKITKSIRKYMDEQSFIDVETPFLAKSTPEGARDYLVPSRISPGKFYALPQSPQLFKQVLMIAGFDKYYQIVKCFRDEDLRKDRQPEFTQLDIEMSFIEEEDIYNSLESLMKTIFKDVLNIDIKTPFPRLTYEQVMKKYKTDSPDLRKKENNFSFCWVTDFPLFEYSEEEARLVSVHHPFTSPKDEHLKFLEKNPEKVKAKAYDLVLNGVEIGGGSIRIHDRKLQEKIFKILKISGKESKERFGFFLEALKYSCPHGGIALGLDRIVAIMTGNDSIREVIAFPKNKAAQDIMTEAPSEVSKEQLKELKLNLKKD